MPRLPPPPTTLSGAVMPLRGQVGVAGKGAERIIQQGADIVVFIGAQLALHGHADEPDAVLLRQTGVAVAGRVGITELGTQNGRDVVPAGANAHLVLLGKVAGHGLDVGGVHGVHLIAGEHLLKARLLQCPAQDLRHIVAAGVVVLVADAVGVAKWVCARPSSFYPRIHLCHAVRDGAAAEIFGQQVGTVVGAGHHGGVQRIRQGTSSPSRRAM